MNNIIFFGDIATWFKYNFWWLLIVLVLIIVTISFIRLQKKPKKVVSKPIEDEQMISFIECYGGFNNIRNASLDGRRLKVELIKIDNMDVERFKTLGATGIFISGNNVKMVLPYDMKKLVEKINEEINGGEK